MKPHLTVRLVRPIDEGPAGRVPHWSDILHNKQAVPERLQPEIDAILAQFQVPVWVTQEYQPQGDRWNGDEIASGLNRVYRLVLQHNQQLPAPLVQKISLIPVVEEVRLGRVGGVDLPRLSRQSSVTPGSRSREQIYLSEAHHFTRGDASVTVAVLDTGVSGSHPELAQAMREGMDFVNIIDGATEFLGDYLDLDNDPDDEVGHGTHVAGIICGEGRAMPPGVAPGCQLLPVRVLAAMRRGDRRVGAGLLENINAGLKYAVDQGADIINMSLGVRHTGGGLPHKEVIDYALRRGVSIVAASGNDGQENLYYPGALDGVIAVGAMDEQGEVAPFSTFGRQVSIVAPGSSVYSTYLDNDYAISSGTSQAAPFVSGAIGLLKSFARSRDRDLSDRQIKHVLKHTADKIDQRFKHRRAGFGRLNLADSLKYLHHHLN